MRPQTISFYTLGCRLNQSETAVVQNSFETNGYKIVDFNVPADVVVINTCTVTENGDADTRRLVHRITRLNPRARIALIGCQAQIQKEKLTELPNVQWIVGNALKLDLLRIIQELSPDGKPQVIAPVIPRTDFTVPLSGKDQNHTRANIKIQDGCDFFCSFCEIPYARGRARSRKFDDILREVQSLVSFGHKEIVITGINVGTYQQESYTLIDVIKAMEQIAGLERIRLSSIEPTTIPLTLLDYMGKGRKLCRYLHIPLQSAHDQILKRMNRQYAFQHFRDFICRALDTVPGICLGTDIITGFPGEEEDHFQETVHRLNALPIHYFHIFSYSSRRVAKSRNFQEAIAPEIIQHRSRILRQLSQQKRRLFYESFIGTTQRVLFEQRKEGTWSGLTDNYIRVRATSTDDLANRFVDIQLLKTHDAGVWGEAIKAIT
ncbi:MAG: tRNA (N(6)-L-threonylcarbamoyladenosine(37)-C(2))-methylthiotransferase MtaB [Omnitrophica WOR_2 bacterium GWA2_45_18]|nr:MAG: tRNA (N(6)-L-threonylcarbamoyladenosine(37)-C(2))-methylthiotransferase MtaB [Omnitrophica WOR_2 bacterium GWA2_45_18]